MFMAERELTEREDGDFSGFGELPEDLRGMLPGAIPDPHMYVGWEHDVYSTASYGIPGGADREYVEPIGTQGLARHATAWRAINYLPRANFESFRAQRFYAYGTAVVPPSGGNTFVNLLVDSASAPVTESNGALSVPLGFGMVIDGLRQFVADSTATFKANGDPDDITWQITVSGSSVFYFGELRTIISSFTEPAKLFIIPNEGSQIQLSVANETAVGDPDARDITVKGMLTGFIFPLDELDDIFRNK